MSLHKAAVTDAEKLAEHLELNYGGSAEPYDHVEEPPPPPAVEQVNVAVDAPAVAPDGPPPIEGA